MERNKLDRFLIRSTLILSGTLKSSMIKVKERMSLYPNISLIGEGNNLDYMLISSSKDRQYMLSISKKGISLTAFSNVSPEYFEKEHLLRLLNFAQVLSDLYSFEISSIFHTIMHFLSSGIKYPSIKVDAPKGRDVELMLSRRIIELHQINEKLLGELEQSKAIISKLIANLLLLEDFKGTVDEIKKRFEVSQETAERALLMYDELKQR